MSTGRRCGETEGKERVQSGQSGPVVERDGVGKRKKKKNKNISTFQYVYLHIHTHSRTHIRTWNIAEVLKSPQCALFICFLFPCYIVSATTAIAAAGDGAGRAGAVTQGGRHSRRAGPRSLGGVAGVLLGLRAVDGVLGGPRRGAGAAHGVDLCEETRPGLVLCIVL